jgi:restriction endonuclease Mrr
VPTAHVTKASYSWLRKRYVLQSTKEGDLHHHLRVLRGALQYSKGLSDKVVLIDGEMLANLMIDHSVGVSLQRSHEVKRVDSDYFSEA